MRENPFRLTEREFEVLDLMTLGLNNGQIAQKIFVSNDTVKAHLKNIFRKMQTKNRIEAVVKAIKFDIVKI